MRSSRQKASISKLDLDQFVFTPPGPMGWQAHDSISAEKEEEEKHLDVGSIRELLTSMHRKNIKKKRRKRKQIAKSSMMKKKQNSKPLWSLRRSVIRNAQRPI